MENKFTLPDTLTGPISGTLEISYTYSTGGSSSHLGHPLEYRFDWGDGALSEWSSSSIASKFWSSPGTYAVRAQTRCGVDPSIESYWSEPLSVVMSSAVLPDLTGQWLSLLQTCRSTRNGLKCQITGKMEIQNIGNLSAPSSLVRFYLSEDGVYHQGAERLLKQAAAASIRIAKNKTMTFSYSFPLGETAADKFIIAVIDANDTVAESNESNNYVVFGPIP